MSCEDAGAETPRPITCRWARLVATFVAIGLVGASCATDRSSAYGLKGETWSLVGEAESGEVAYMVYEALDGPSQGVCFGIDVAINQEEFVAPPKASHLVETCLTKKGMREARTRAFTPISVQRGRSHVVILGFLGGRSRELIAKDERGRTLATARSGLRHLGVMAVPMFPDRILVKGRDGLLATCRVNHRSLDIMCHRSRSSVA